MSTNSDGPTWAICKKNSDESGRAISPTITHHCRLFSPISFCTSLAEQNLLQSCDLGPAIYWWWSASYPESPRVSFTSLLMVLCLIFPFANFASKNWIIFAQKNPMNSSFYSGFHLLKWRLPQIIIMNMKNNFWMFHGHRHRVHVVTSLKVLSKWFIIRVTWTKMFCHNNYTSCFVVIQVNLSTVFLSNIIIALLGHAHNL